MDQLHFQTFNCYFKVWDKNTLVPDTFLGEINQPINVNNKHVIETHQLMEKESKEGAQKAEGTISYKIAASSNLQFM